METAVEMPAELVASVALVRYVQFHTNGHSPDAVAQELHFLVRHFEFKTGCTLYLPSLPREPTALTTAAKLAARMGQGLLTTVLSRVSGI